MTEQELEAILKEQGWSLDIVQRYRTRYAYAKKHIGGHVRTRYISSLNKLESITKEHILKRIQL